MINSQLLVYINLAVGLLFLAYFFWGKPKSAEPVRLNLKRDLKEIEKNKAILQTSLSEDSAFKKNDATEAQPRGSSLATPEVTKIRNLSVLFIYNGHDWEAHDVLGVPQGASLKLITEEYQKQILSAQASALPFLESAYSALTERHRKHRL